MESMSKKVKVAVIGGGVSGLASAWHLHVNTEYDVHLFESESTLGGHAHTTVVNGTPVDIGFMVFNHINYPNLTAWFKCLGVDEEDSNMSLSISLDGGNSVEWSSSGLNGLFAKRSQAYSPSFYTFLLDMMRFHREAAEILLLSDDDPRKNVSVGQYLRDHGYSTAFATNYLLPMMAALWSASLSDVLQFPAAQLMAFLCNHKMLQMFDRRQWKTVAGRSTQYTSKVQALLGENVHVSSPIVSVSRNKDNDAYTLHGPDNQDYGTFDQIVFACHPPTAKAMLERGSCFSDNQELLTVLDQIEYADNVIYVHSDPKLMPKRQRAWASWNCLGKAEELRALQQKRGNSSGDMKESTPKYTNGHDLKPEDSLEGEHGRMKAVYVTYWLNGLQNLETDHNIFVSLNPHQRPDPALTYKRLIMAHPQFNLRTLQAREKLQKNFQGRDGLWFAGAWAGYGFHEDGCRSGFQVATALSRVPLPWVQNGDELVLAPPNMAQSHLLTASQGLLSSLRKAITYDLPISICKPLIIRFLRNAIRRGRLNLKLNDGSLIQFGDGAPCGVGDASPVTLRIFDNWWFVKTALEYDVGLARSYMAGHFVVEPLDDPKKYHPVIRPDNASDETTLTIGDPIGLTRLFLLLIGNRDAEHIPHKSARQSYSNALTTASGLLISRLGSLLNYLKYKLTMDNSENGGSMRNIHAHYDLSNDLFRTFLDKDTMLYSCAIFDAVRAPSPYSGLVFRGSLEEAQWRKVDTYLARAQVQHGQTLLDIGFGWGGLSMRAAQKYKCHVTGITLSVEQKSLAEQRVRDAGLQSFIHFEVVDYRTFCRRPENRGKFDRVVSCEMIEAVGHNHLGDFFWSVEQVLSGQGILVLGAITTPEQRYETYRRSTDFMNSVIFPGGCCPSLHALVDAAYKNSTLTLEHIDNIGLHYAETLREWRRRFNQNEATVRAIGFDDVFLRVWNYYMTYCEAGFFSQTVNMLILVWARQGCGSLVPLSETRCVTPVELLTDRDINNLVTEWNNQ